MQLPVTFWEPEFEAACSPKSLLNWSNKISSNRNLDSSNIYIYFFVLTKQ